MNKTENYFVVWVEGNTFHDIRKFANSRDAYIYANGIISGLHPGHHYAFNSTDEGSWKKPTGLLYEDYKKSTYVYVATLSNIPNVEYYICVVDHNFTVCSILPGYTLRDAISSANNVIAQEVPPDMKEFCYFIDVNNRAGANWDETLVVCITRNQSL